MENNEADSSDFAQGVTENEPLLSENYDVAHVLPKVRFPSCRLVLTFMAFLGFVNIYCLRVNLSVALVAMVNYTNQPFANVSRNYSESDSGDYYELHESTTVAMEFGKDDTGGGEFNWDSRTQGNVLAAFFYGYILTQVVGGWLAERIGGKLLFGGGVLVTSGLSLLTPVTARCSVYMLIALRVLEGISEGVTYPAMYALLSCWIPPIERSRAVTFAFSGSPVGTVVGMLLSGVLCDHGFAGGWPSVFYVFGAVGCLWSFAWYILCYSDPSVHPRISVAERQYIEKSLESREIHAKPPTPWKKIATSPPFWALAAALFANNWGGYTLLTCLPKYMHDVLQFDMTQDGLLSALPYIATWMFTTGGGQLADWLRAPHRLRTTTVRKLFNAAGLLIPGIFLVAVGLLELGRILTVCAIVMAVGSAGLAISGFGVNHLDLAPAHAGTLMGLTNTLGTVPGFLGSEVVGVLTSDESTRAQWQTVFYIATAIYVFSAAVFVVFGSGELQDWAVVPQTTADNEVLNAEREQSLERRDMQNIN